MSVSFIVFKNETTVLSISLIYKNHPSHPCSIGFKPLLTVVSAAAVVASALLELSTYLPNGKGKYYKDAAIEMLSSLSSRHYQSGKSKPSFLLHSVGHWPNHSEIDASIIYADYYYIEALLRLKRLREGQTVQG